MTTLLFSCQEETTPELEEPQDEQEIAAGDFYFGADLS